MKFFIKNYQEIKNRVLIYRNKDYSFDVVPIDGAGGSSILINDLQLEIDYEGNVMYVWGYCPLIEYEETELFPQKDRQYELVVLLDNPPKLGVSYRLNEDNNWPIHINKKKGWVCLGDPNMEGKQLIQFAPSCIASMLGQELTAVWLQPEQLPPLGESETEKNVKKSKKKWIFW